MDTNYTNLTRISKMKNKTLGMDTNYLKKVFFSRTTVNLNIIYKKAVFLIRIY